MNHWTIGDGELRRQVGMQAERYQELRRRSDEARMREAACGPHLPLGERLRSWFEATWRGARHTPKRERAISSPLEHRRG